MTGLGRLAGLDFGTVRIGIALSDPGRTLASPWETYTRCGAVADARYFQDLVAQQQIVTFVVGLPLHASGDESAKSKQARQFGQWLQDTTGIAVEYYDERYSTVEAEQALEGAGLTRRQRKKRLDHVAAQMILAAYLEAYRSRSVRNEPLD